MNTFICVVLGVIAYCLVVYLILGIFRKTPDSFEDDEPYANHSDEVIELCKPLTDMEWMPNTSKPYVPGVYQTRFSLTREIEEPMYWNGEMWCSRQTRNFMTYFQTREWKDERLSK